MSNHRCTSRTRFHRWGVWSRTTLERWNAQAAKVIPTDRQQRVCDRCGLTESTYV